MRPSCSAPRAFGRGACPPRFHARTLAASLPRRAALDRPRPPHYAAARVTALRNLGLALFSTWAWVGGFSWMLVGATGTMLLRVVGVPYQRVHGWITAPMFVQVVTVFAAARVKIHYHPDFDPNRRSVFTQNHINLLDGHLASA